MDLPPSQINSINYWPIIQWIILIAFIFFLIYMARVIAKEKESYSDSAKLDTFHGLLLLLPSWWSKTLEKSNLWQFERTDSPYEWFCRLSYENSTHHNLQDELQQYFLQEEILFDPEDSIITSEANHLIKDPLLLSNIKEFLRIEGTATEKQIERVYIDSCWISLKNNSKHIYHFMSYSSVLNGSLEGPYFEEVLKRLKMKEASS
jgi:hypothetical protein